MSLLFLGSTHDKQGFSETADELRVALGRVNSKPVLTQGGQTNIEHQRTEKSDKRALGHPLIRIQSIKL